MPFPSGAAIPPRTCPNIYNNIARQLDWYHDNKFIFNESYLLTLRQAPATQIGGQSSNNFVKKFAAESCTVSSSTSRHTYKVTNGVLTIT